MAASAGRHEFKLVLPFGVVGTFTKERLDEAKHFAKTLVHRYPSVRLEEFIGGCPGRVIIFPLTQQV